MTQKIINDMKEFKALLRSFNYQESLVGTEVFYKPNNHQIGIYNNDQFFISPCNDSIRCELSLPIKVNFHHYINDSDKFYAIAVCDNVNFRLVK